VPDTMPPFHPGGWEDDSDLDDDGYGYYYEEGGEEDLEENEKEGEKDTK
jgi:hypothetical protein